MSFAVLALATMALGAAPSLANQLQVKGGAAMAWHVIISPSCSTRRPRHAFHDALVRPSPSYTMGPSLAESWEESEDGKIYEFKLRAGLKFHNGDPLTTELDVIRASTGTGAPGPRPCATTSKSVPYDRDKAKKLLSETGYSDGFDAGRFTPNPAFRPSPTRR